MGNKMLIDAAHPEETRVVVLRGNRIEEFDFESASKKQLRGNIYLAKVTRVEPSLQAAFIEYGGNRHGFLAFSEIHPDYYQIPVADRQALLEDEARSADEDDEEPRGGGQANGGGNNASGGDRDRNGGHRRSRRHRRGGQGSAEKRSAAPHDEAVSSEEIARSEAEATPVALENDGTFEGLKADDAAGAAAHDSALAGETEAELPLELSSEPGDAGSDTSSSMVGDPAGDATDEAGSGDPLEGGVVSDDEGVLQGSAGEDGGLDSAEVLEAAPAGPEQAEARHEGGEESGDNEADATEGHEEEGVEQLGGDALEDVPHRVSRPRRNYKIQEVIKRRQVLLVQVVKEERGNKGAALTTYLSLAGRYSVLMPNTARGGGISRKIVDPEDRKRLKAIAQELEVPDGMGIILRTAGASRSMPEVKRDFEYLMRMWETVRETTLSSSAPTLVYEEGSLIKRSIRDLFTKDVDEVVVSGDEAYREAKDFMRLLMPNQVRNVVAWREPQPIFAKSGAETQLDAMFSNQVTLKSGGYLVINQTEALVAIDVNSGRSTREHNIEDTALRTNLEAADEVARQLRLRDLAGLIVVDFIDMEEGRNDRAVERRIKDALKNDRARIQIGRISHFGLLEMSRQRMRTGVLEGSTVMCPHCAGSGTVRSVSSMALHVLRLLEDALIRSAAFNLTARTRAEVAIYILNQKRANLLDLEARFGVSITVLADAAMIGMVYHAVERGTEATPPAFLPFRPEAPSEATLADEDEAFEAVDELLEGGSEDIVADGDVDAPRETPGDGEASRQALDDGEGRRRRRRRRRRGGRDAQNGAVRDGQDAVGPREERGGEEEIGTADVVSEDADDAEITADVDSLSDAESGFLPESVPQASDKAGDAAPSVPAAPLFEAPEAFAAPASVLAPDPEVIPATAEPTAEPVAEPGDVVDAPRRRRTTRRTTRQADAAPADAAPADAAVSTDEVLTPTRRARRPRAKAGDLPLDLEGAALPSADRDVGADTAQQHPAAEPQLPLLQPAVETPSADRAETSEAAPVSAPATAATASAPPSEPDPDRPKRSGWWQRAKATFSTGS